MEWISFPVSGEFFLPGKKRMVEGRAVGVRRKVMVVFTSWCDVILGNECESRILTHI